jgi:CheY-like chemotaxis protein
MVDDEPELVRATVEMLGTVLGPDQVRGTTDSRELASWIEREKPTALITDVRMPHINGLELVTRLHARWGAVPVVVMTAYPTAQVDQEAKAGRFAYLPKPFSFSALRDTLGRICTQPAPSAFSGAIAVSMLDEVVQLYGLANRTGTLRVDSPSGAGLIGFDSGRVIDARVGELRGIEAFNFILSWSSGSFSWSATEATEQTITMGLSELLLEAYRLRDEQEAGLTNDDDAFRELELEPAEMEQQLAHVGTNVRHHFDRLEQVDGFVAAALFDLEADSCVHSISRRPELPIEASAKGHGELVAAKRATIARLNLSDELEDIVISLGREYHLLRLCRRQPQRFYFLTLDRQHANLAMARYVLSEVERDTVG